MDADLNSSWRKHKESFEKHYSQFGYIRSWEDKIAQPYARLRVELGYRRRNREIVKRAKGKANYILDLGCGVGDLLLPLSKMGRFVVGSEMSEVNMASCKRNVLGTKNILLCLSIAEFLPFKSNIFDKVILADVIEHVLDERQALAEINRVLKQQGMLILTTPNRENKQMERFWNYCNLPCFFLRRLLTRLKGRRRMNVVTVKDQVLTPSQVSSLLLEGGFRILDHKLIEFYPRGGGFDLLLKFMGQTIRTKFAEPLFSKIFAIIERLGYFNNRQIVLAQKP